MVLDHINKLATEKKQGLKCTIRPMRKQMEFFHFFAHGRTLRAGKDECIVPQSGGVAQSSPPINIKFLFSFLLLKMHTSLHYTLWYPRLCHCNDVSPSPKHDAPLAYWGLRPHLFSGYYPAPQLQISTNLDTLLEKPDSKINILCQKQQDQTKQNKTKSKETKFGVGRGGVKS